mmetsp:Transcript_110628/g.191775  ORF Transcript_110628/g.191775 Transcript_110628/m.191775 type:complete len:93 (-) Transcript_110628:698-976(-)
MYFSSVTLTLTIRCTAGSFLPGLKGYPPLTLHAVGGVHRTNLNEGQPVANRSNNQPNGSFHMVALHFEGPESISGLGVAQFLVFWPDHGAQP